ncbi:hypothetical protein QUF75_18435 [Desulfococcaceae bacterium HSG7]|nr:hypothetical protein [Desulfococcaceae bacterium HSG7]
MGAKKTKIIHTHTPGRRPGFPGGRPRPTATNDERIALPDAV